MSRRSRRPNGSRVNSSRATSLDMTRDFTRPTPSRDTRPPVRRPAPGWFRSTSTRSTRSGPIGRPRRWARSRRTSCVSRAKAQRRRSSACGRPSGPSQGLLISDPHNLAWLFNIRGSDVSYTPLPIGWAYLPLEGRPVAFLDGRKLTPVSRQSLSRHAEVLEPDALLAFVEDLGRQGVRVAFDAATVPAYLTQAIERAGGKADIGADPITLMKAKKNPFELAGARAAHERDGAAMANFLAWFAHEAPRGRLTEIDAVKALETFRRASPALKDLSFPTIAGAGPEFSHPPLSGQRRLQSENRARHFSHRQRRAIRRRHDRHHPHDRRRAAERAHARPVHPCAERSHRGRPRRLSAWNERRPDRRAGARARFGEPASISTTAPDTASGRISRCTKALSASPRPERPRSRRG